MLSLGKEIRTMGRREVLQSSTYRDITGNWWRARLTDDDFRWAQRNLVPDKSGRCDVERSPTFKRLEGNPPAAPTVPADWGRRVCFSTTQEHPWVLMEFGEQYRLREIAETARLHRDPELAPHVAFRKLKHGNNAVALGFLKDFGPLFRDDWSSNALTWVNLDDFWRKHARFVAVMRLYEAMNDYEQLRDVWLDVARNVAALDKAGPAALGMIPHTQKGIPYLRRAYVYGPEDYLLTEADGDQKGQPIWPLHTLQLFARELIVSELTLQTHAGLASTWIVELEDGAPKFRPERAVLSLWAGMWELFGLDTCSGNGWRVCKICGKYFYPLQRNSNCCNPIHQALWSKRDYARKVRSGTQAKTRKASRGN
jgi:hypothetical protein